MVETRFLNWTSDGTTAEMFCGRRDDRGAAYEIDPENCRNFYNCTICNQDGECRVVPFEKCDLTIGYSPNDHQKILLWGRRNLRN